MFFCPSAAAQRPLNLGFELESALGAARPWGWYPSSGPDSAFHLDDTVRRRGARSVRLGWGEGAAGAAGAPLALQLRIPLASLGGQGGGMVRVVGYSRADIPSAAAVVLQAAHDATTRSADTSRVDRRPADHWSRHVLELSIDSTVTSLTVTLVSTAASAVWFDDFSLTVSGKALESLHTGERVRSAAARAALRPVAMKRTPVAQQRAGSAQSTINPALDSLVGESRLVGLGESTHGTSEFFAVKAELVRQLVTHRGFRLLAFEGNQLAVEALNRYVRDGTGTAKQALRSLYAIWNSEEVLALVEWVRAYNVSHPDDRVAIAGFDMQDPRWPVLGLRSTLSRLAPAIGAQLDSLYREYEQAWTRAAYPRADQQVMQQWEDRARSALSLLERTESVWRANAVSAADSAAAEWVLQNARVIVQAALFARTEDPAVRDSAMAANLIWSVARRGSGGRAVLWAHDAHISRGRPAAGGNRVEGGMGRFLAGLDIGYRPVSLLTATGTYSATPSRSNWSFIPATLHPPPAGSIEQMLSSAIGMSNPSAVYVVDTRRACGASGAHVLPVLCAPLLKRQIGFVTEDWGFYPAIMAEEFDAVVFIPVTTRSRLLR